MEVVDTELFNVFLGSIPMHLIMLLSGSLFFFTVATRDLKNGIMQGVLSLAFACFLAAAHLMYLFNLPEESGFGLSTISLLGWAVDYLAPSMVILLIIRGLWDLIVQVNPNGLIRLFWSVTLIAYLYLLGTDWPTDVRASIVAFYFAIFLIIETDPADGPMLTAWRAQG